MAIHSKYLETLQAILGTALNIVKSPMLADLYVRREYTGDFRVRVKLDNGDRYIITIKEENAPRTETVIAEIGTDMSPFPTVGHLLSWAGFVPRLDESAGKRRSTRIRKGAPWLEPVLVQAAWGAARKKNSYFQAQFLRLKARRGAKKAAIAVARRS
jgi:transposase